MQDRLVLCYHGLSDDWPNELAVSPATLREQVGFLLRRGYRGVTFSELARPEASGKMLAVTFDDGYRSVLERGLPVLSKLGVPATIFVPTDFVGSPEPMSWPGIDSWTPGPYQDELRCLGWEELRELQDAGWEIGSHTRSHPRLTEIDDRALARELAGSREACERELGIRCKTLAYPFGAHDERVERATRDAGYEAAATLSFGPDSAFVWPRVPIYPVDDLWRFRIKSSRTVRRLRRRAAGRMIERIGS